MARITVPPFASLPSAERVELALQKEATIPGSQSTQTFVDFSSVVDLSKALGLDASFFHSSSSLEQLIADAKHWLAELYIGLNDLWIGLDPPSLLLNQVFDYLTEEDSPEKADMIFVFGSRAHHRIKAAIELFRQQYAPLLYLSGGAPLDIAVAKSEAEIYAEIAEQNGIPRNAIIVEPYSVTVADSVKRFLQAQKTAPRQVSSLILVTAPFAQRRSSAMFRRFSNNRYKVIRRNAASSDMFSRDNWYESAEGFELIFVEMIKLRIAQFLETA